MTICLYYLSTIGLLVSFSTCMAAAPRAPNWLVTPLVAIIGLQHRIQRTIHVVRVMGLNCSVIKS